MNRPFLMSALFVAAAAALGAQQGSQSGSYEGTSTPPPDDTIITSSAPAPIAKPSAGTPMYPSAQPVAQAPARYQSQSEPRPTSVDPSVNYPDSGNDDGIVQIAPDQPALNQRTSQRASAYDPDGDIVHPGPLGPGELGEGTTIRVRLLQRLSTTDSVDGEVFKTRVATDVLQGGQVLIPAGSEIDGRVLNVSSGRPGGHGSMHLRPDTVTLPGGARYRLYAQVTGTPGSTTRVGSEGVINPGSRLKRDGIEYGGTVGAGAVTGAFLGGPVGALAGSLVGAGVVSAHLLISHPQATLEAGTTLLFTLTEPLNLVPAGASSN